LGALVDVSVMGGSYEVYDVPREGSIEAVFPRMTVDGLMGVDATLNAELSFPRMTLDGELAEIEEGIAIESLPIRFGSTYIGVGANPLEYEKSEAPQFFYVDAVFPGFTAGGLATFPIEASGELRFP